VSYTSRAALESQVGTQLILDLCDDEKIGAGNPLIDTRIASVISSVDAVINGYCRVRYTVPFLPVPALIAHISEHLALYHLHLRRASGLELPEYVKELHKDANKLLEDLRTGHIDPGVEPPPAASTGEVAQVASLDQHGNTTTAPAHLFTVDSMKGF
jgi:phage gp36-like protein